MLIGQEKGFDTERCIKHNFGMHRPEGYRKVVRLLDLAERFKNQSVGLMPIISGISKKEVQGEGGG